MTLYIGNLSHKASEEEVANLFSTQGPVASVKIIKDQLTGRSRGFAFVDMEDDDSANKAIEAINETEFLGRTIYVSIARPKAENTRPQGGGDYSRNKGNRY